MKDKKEIIPVEKYVEKALIDEIFSSTVGVHSSSKKEMPRYFKILKKNLIDTITIKEEEEKNKSKNPSLNFRFLNKKNSYNDIFNDLNNIQQRSLYHNKTLTRTMVRRGLTKRSMTSKYSSVFKIPKSNREILSSFGFRNINKDFTDITSNINYLLNKNQTLLMKEKTFIDGFDFSHKTKLNNNIFLQKNFFSRNGLFGKKEEIPLIYEQSFTYKNDYPSKSEKNRHEYLLNEINKLKFYLERNKYDKLSLIKDFFLKLNIKDIDKYPDDKLINIGTFILSKDENELLNVIKPDNNLKRMVYNLLNIPFNKTQNNFYHKINLYNIGYTPNNIIMNIYPRSRNKLLSSKKNFGVFETNSKLKYIENQKELYKPEKQYSENLDLIINDIGKEIKNFEANKSFGKEKRNDNLFFITQSKNKTISHKELINKNKTFSYLNIKKIENIKKGTYLVFAKNLTKKLKKPNEPKYKKLNFCLKSRKRSIEIEDKNKIKNEEINKKKYKTKDIIQRLYYKPNFKILGFNEIKRSKKLTEFIALNLAKKKSRIESIVKELNPYHKDKTLNI